MQYERVFFSLPEGGLLGASDSMTKNPVWNYWVLAIQDASGYYVWVKGVSTRVTPQEMVELVKSPQLTTGSAAMKVHERIEVMRHLGNLSKGITDKK